MEYPNSGVLWTSTLEKRSDKAPDMYGDISIERDFLHQLMQEQEGNLLVKIKLDGWRKKDKNGNPMVSLKVNTYKKPGQEQQSNDNAKDPWDE